MRKIAWFFGILAVFLLLIPVSLRAAEFRSSQSGAEVIGSGETLRNLYVANGTVEINGTIQKDLVVGGGVVNLNSSVEDDAIIGAGQSQVGGTVGGNLRAFAGNLSVNGSIGEDAVLGGGTVVILPEAVVGGDLIAAAGNMNIGGLTNGRVMITGGNITISGRINSDVIAKNVERLTIGDTAAISGKLTYSSPNQATISPNATIGGGVDFQQIKAKKFQDSTGFVLSLVLYELVGTLLLALFFIYGLSKLTKGLTEKAFLKFWPALGWGILSFIVVPVILMLLLFTIIGIKASLFFMLLYCLFLFAAAILVPILIGSLLFKWIKRQKGYYLDWIRALAGIIVVIALMMIPVIGWTVLLIFFVLAFGSIVMTMYDFFINQPAK